MTIELTVFQGRAGDHNDLALPAAAALASAYAAELGLAVQVIGTPEPALSADWRVIAPDWRGFGLTEWRGDAYWFPDYLGDLDAILRFYSPEAAVTLIGHSMGGNVACMYAGVRPARVRRLIALDAFGLADSDAGQAPGRLEKWLRELETPPQFGSFPSRDALAARLQGDNPRLSNEKAAFLAEHLGEPDGQGGIRRAGDPAHKRVNPILYRRAEARAAWARMTAQTL